jgi:glycosyltransferase involved in cell wall biosynthesis
MAVVGTQTGGSPEILADSENALVFPKGDAQACAENVARLANDRELFDRIRHNARRTVASRHTIEHMVKKVEVSLTKVADAH